MIISLIAVTSSVRVIGVPFILLYPTASIRYLSRIIFIHWSKRPASSPHAEASRCHNKLNNSPYSKILQFNKQKNGAHSRTVPITICKNS
jgi:hypothetical protein